MDLASVLPLLQDVVGSGVEVTSRALLKEKQDYWVWDVRTQTPDLHLKRYNRKGAKSAKEAIE